MGVEGEGEAGGAGAGDDDVEGLGGGAGERGFEGGELRRVGRYVCVVEVGAGRVGCQGGGMIPKGGVGFVRDEGRQGVVLPAALGLELCGEVLPVLVFDVGDCHGCAVGDLC